MKPFTLEFAPPHEPPEITAGRWYIETDGIEEYEIVDEKGRLIAQLWDKTPDHELPANAQCIALVPELVRAVYVASRALRGNLPENETEATIAEKLGQLLKRCYSSPEQGGTIKP